MTCTRGIEVILGLPKYLESRHKRKTIRHEYAERACRPKHSTRNRSDGASDYRFVRRYVAGSLPSSVASVWRPMPHCRSCHGGRRHLPVANALAGGAWSDLRAIFACGISRVHGACLCDALPLRLHRRCGEPLALDRDSKRAHFCRSRRAQCEELALVPCRRNRIARISLGFLALSELVLHARLVHICLPGDGRYPRSVCGGACSRVSEGVAH